MCGDRGITSCASKILAVLVGDVFTFTILVALRQAEVNDIDVVASSISATNQEIIRLDVSVDDALLVDLLNTTYQLHCNHKDSLQVKVPFA